MLKAVVKGEYPALLPVQHVPAHGDGSCRRIVRDRKRKMQADTMIGRPTVWPDMCARCARVR